MPDSNGGGQAGSRGCTKCGTTEAEVAAAEGVDGVICVACLAEIRPRPDGAYSRSLSSVQPEPIRWLWDGRIPLGMLSMLAGDPGLGKSLLTVDMAAKTSRAGADVLLLSAEDHASQTLRPRAEAAGADLSRVHVAAMNVGGMDEGLRLPDDVEQLDRLVEQHAARLVVIDPLAAHLAEQIDSHNDKSSRSALAPLHHLAERRGCAIVFVLHLNKAKGSDPLYRTGGSIAVPAAVRSALLLARDPEDPDGDRGRQRVLAHFKCNLGELAESLAYRVETVEVGQDLFAPRLHKIGESEVSGAELLNAPSGEERTARVEASEILREELAGGLPISAKLVARAAKEAGISDRTLERAKRDLGVVAEREGFGPDGEWVWRLPIDRHPCVSTVAAYGANGSVEPNDPFPEPLYAPPLAAYEENGSSKPNTSPEITIDRHAEGLAGNGGEAA